MPGVFFLIRTSFCKQKVSAYAYQLGYSEKYIKNVVVQKLENFQNFYSFILKTNVNDYV